MASDFSWPVCLARADPNLLTKDTVWSCPFLPVENLGGWHDQTVSLVKRLGSALARQTGQEESEAI